MGHSRRRFGVDRRVVGELLVLHLHDHDGLVRVALGVDRDLARRPLEALGAGDGVADGLRRVALGPADRVREHLRRVVAHGRERRRVALVAIAVGLHEGLRAGPGHVGRDSGW